MSNDGARPGRYWDEMGAESGGVSARPAPPAAPLTRVALVGYLPASAPAPWGVPARVARYAEFQRRFAGSEASARAASFGSLLLSRPGRGLRPRPEPAFGPAGAGDEAPADPARFPLPACVYHYFANGGAEAVVVALRPPPAVGDADPPPADAATGARLFDRNGALARASFGLLCLPGITDPAILAAAAAFCARRGAVLLVDPPDPAPGASPASAFDGLPAGPNAAAFYPRVRATDPHTRQPADLPASAFVAGLLARADRERGVWASPAGSGAELVGASFGSPGEARAALDPARLAAAVAAGVNCLCPLPGGGVGLPAAPRTLPAAPNGEPGEARLDHQRLRLHLEHALSHDLGWTGFSPNGALRETLLRDAAADLLRALEARGAFAPAPPGSPSPWSIACAPAPTDRAPGALRLTVTYRPADAPAPTTVSVTFAGRE